MVGENKGKLNINSPFKVEKWLSFDVIITPTRKFIVISVNL